MRKLFCFVLMPFSDQFTFVYEFGIKPALQKLEKLVPLLEFQVERADERLAIKEDKVKEIVKLIKKCDLIVVDITGGSLSVLWELGFCHALQKNVIILAQTTENLPFYIRTRDVFRYKFSVAGLREMEKTLSQKLTNAMGQIQRNRLSLGFDEEIEELIRGVQEGLARIDKESILKNLARNEIRRLFGRVVELQRGQFDLRNEKPNKEIIQYFCDYVSQLDVQDCEYDTVSFYQFWKEITNQGKDFEYLMANIQAVKAGARIRRVFIIDGDKYPNKNVAIDPLFQKILDRHFFDTEEHRDKIETRVFFSSNYDADIRTYKNFGIWRKGSERILFKPEYLEDGRMSKTLFVYYNQQKLDNPNFKDNKKEIDKYKINFREVWRKSEKLETKHFQ